MQLKKFLTSPIDNSALIVFRVFFGFLMFCEAIGAMLLGWVQETFVEVNFTFNFIGFDFLQVFVGPQMYAIYVGLAIVSIMIMLGYRYRFAIITFTILWGITYLAQKSHYNNHYYLIWLIGFILCFLPANAFYALDVKQGRVDKQLTCPRWCVSVLMFQVAIVYFYASVAKIYPDWLAGKPIEIWYSYKSFETPFWSDAFAKQLKSFFSLHSVHLFFAYAGIFFDLLVVPFFLLNRTTRLLALIASLCFHLLNSAIFQIGVFPYFALAFVIFFYAPETIRKLLFKRRKPSLVGQALTTDYKTPKWIAPVFIIYFMFQVGLPLRHHLIPGNVLWTEEGHRLSWRMMLRTKRSYTRFIVKDNHSSFRENIRLFDHVSRTQYSDLMSKPDFMWQFAQKMENYYENELGYEDVSIYVTAQVGVNGRKKSQLTDDTIDIANTKWKTFGHQDWLLDAPF